MARKAKEPTLPIRIRRIVMMCEAGQALCVAIKKSEVGDERAYWFEPSGKSAPPKSAERAIELGLLAPAGDGLFGDSQTYRIAS